MALVAVITNHSGAEEIVGISRYVTPPNQSTCEFSLSVSDSHAAHGIGTHLMLDLIAHAKENGLQEMLGYVLSKNLKMLHLVSDLGFQITNLNNDPEFKTVSLPMSSTPMNTSNQIDSESSILILIGGFTRAADARHRSRRSGAESMYPHRQDCATARDSNYWHGAEPK